MTIVYVQMNEDGKYVTREGSNQKNDGRFVSGILKEQRVLEEVCNGVHRMTSIYNTTRAYAEEGDGCCAYVETEVRSNDEDDAQRHGDDRPGSFMSQGGDDKCHTQDVADNDAPDGEGRGADIGVY